MSFKFTGDLTPKTNKEEGQFNSVSDQYQESYFHPLIMTGTVNLQKQHLFFNNFFNIIW